MGNEATQTWRRRKGHDLLLLSKLRSCFCGYNIRVTPDLRIFSMWAAWRETGDSIWTSSLGNVTCWVCSCGVTIIARRYCRGPPGLS